MEVTAISGADSFKGKSLGKNNSAEWEKRQLFLKNSVKTHKVYTYNSSKACI